MDSITRFFGLFEQAFAKASWKAVFGEPQRHDQKTLIPVASVSYGFGLGGGSAPKLAGDEAAAGSAENAGGGGGGGGQTTPIALIEITPQRVAIRPIIHWEKVILAFLFMVCWTTYFGTSISRKALENEERGR